jgi:hypothetical protein
MTELELTLRDLGGRIKYPPTPDLRTAVRARLAVRARPPWWRASRRQALAIALATLAVAVAAVLAVPSARTAILRFFDLGAVRIERVATLPPAEERPLAAGLGAPVPLREAERQAGFRMVLPPLERPLRRAYVRDGLLAALLELEEVGPVLLTEIRGDQADLAKKALGGRTDITPIEVNGRFGYWIEGAPHVLVYIDPDGRMRELSTRLAGNVLVWRRHNLTLRLEGELTREQALELARSIG